MQPFNRGGCKPIGRACTLARRAWRDHNRQAATCWPRDTAYDLAELERVLAESGVGETDEIKRAAEVAQGLGLFVRSLVGLDRAAAKQALAEFIEARTHTANQLEFINLIVDHLTEHGVMEAARLYESPFTDLTPQGPDGLFPSGELDALMRAIDAVRKTAVAA